MKKIIRQYLKHLNILGRSYYTIRKIKYSLNDFTRFLDHEGIFHIENLIII